MLKRLGATEVNKYIVDREELGIKKFEIHLL